ncbi:MAG: Uma2 family endonuclease [bacterium]|nr:Uma2 family endonuclease [bacterium]
MGQKTPTTQRPITLDDINAVDYIDQYKKIEVVDGDWSMAEVPFYRSHDMFAGGIHSDLMFKLGQFVMENHLGRVYAGSLGFVLKGTRDNIQLMRRTDVSFFKTENLKHEKQDEPYYRAPDLAVEILSGIAACGDQADDVFQRVEDFLLHGTAQVWIVAPSPKQILVFLSGGTVGIYRSGDTLPGGDLLPGFSLDVGAVFEEFNG